MEERAALKVALDLLHIPWRVKLVRAEPLPPGVPLLLGVAASKEAAQDAAVKAVDRPLEVIQQAATFFIEQILLSPDADSYRILGANAEASDGELRRNMALLMTWLHPDKAGQDERSIFAARITKAWNNLKTPERRAAYDQTRRLAKTRDWRDGISSDPRGRNSRSRRSRRGRLEETRGLRRMLELLFGRPRY
jgi:DnaJ domain